MNVNNLPKKIKTLKARALMFHSEKVIEVALSQNNSVEILIVLAYVKGMIGYTTEVSKAIMCVVRSRSTNNKRNVLQNLLFLVMKNTDPVKADDLGQGDYSLEYIQSKFKRVRFRGSEEDVKEALILYSIHWEGLPSKWIKSSKGDFAEKLQAAVSSA